MELKYNFHTHTYRCGHATGTDEDYVKAAIESGFEELGFSDHVILKWFKQPGTRGNYRELKGYIESINSLKKKYENEIKIHLGFECEYYPYMVGYYKSLLKKKKVEYLILGQHNYLSPLGKFRYYITSKHKYEKVEKYVRDLIKGMSTGLFAYVCHPDLFVLAFEEDDPVIEKHARAICEASLKYDIPLEINLAGIRGEHSKQRKVTYPYRRFWEIASEMGVKVVIGVDAHNPEDFKTSNYQFAFDMVRDLNLKFLDDYHIIKK